MAQDESASQVVLFAAGVQRQIFASCFLVDGNVTMWHLVRRAELLSSQAKTLNLSCCLNPAKSRSHHERHSGGPHRTTLIPNLAGMAFPVGLMRLVGFASSVRWKILICALAIYLNHLRSPLVFVVVAVIESQE